MYAKRQYKCITLIAVAMLMLTASGCSLIQERSPTAQLTVQYATLKVIEQSSTVTAADVLRNVQSARALVESDSSITLAGLSQQVRARIDWARLDAADRLLLNAVLTEVELQLDERIGDGALSAEDRVTIGTLLDWIEQAARMTGNLTAEDSRFMLVVLERVSRTAHVDDPAALVVVEVVRRLST